MRKTDVVEGFLDDLLLGRHEAAAEKINLFSAWWPDRAEKIHEYWQGFLKVPGSSLDLQKLTFLLERLLEREEP